MKWNAKRRAQLKQFEERLEQGLEQGLAQLQTLRTQAEEAISPRSSAARVATTAAWVTGAVAVLAAGLYAGKELRSRYKFKRRTPYDYYAHSGDRSELEFGVGI